MGSGEGAEERGVGREQVAFSSRQPSWIAVEQMAGQLGLSLLKKASHYFITQGSGGNLLPFCLYLIN